MEYIPCKKELALEPKLKNVVKVADINCDGPSISGVVNGLKLIKEGLIPHEDINEVINDALESLEKIQIRLMEDADCAEGHIKKLEDIIASMGGGTVNDPEGTDYNAEETRHVADIDTTFFKDNGQMAHFYFRCGKL